MSEGFGLKLKLTELFPPMTLCVRDSAASQPAKPLYYVYIDNQIDAQQLSDAPYFPYTALLSLFLFFHLTSFFDGSIYTQHGGDNSNMRQ